MRILVAILAVVGVAACGQEGAPPGPSAAEPATPAAPEPSRLETVLAAQPEEVEARYRYRHPRETLEFFGVKPGMTVVETLPGGGWYTRILLPYLGAEGRVIGVNYALGLWEKFGFLQPEQLKQMETWAADFPVGAAEWRSPGDAEVSAFVFGALPEDMKGTADVVLFIRALHNMARFEADGGFLTSAINDAWDVLAPGGVVGIVQHRAPEDAPDAWANGSAGYLKESYVTSLMEAAGFELMGSTDVNANPKDRPTNADVVWRLPPTLQTSQNDEALAARMNAIGESDRMTLKFRKPG